ncbi:MAG TPA: DNA translocase FtsK, partial [Chloroflexi bacterium]|nr:DNA translocase FtsK [Chloroflexota bacterium]
QFSLPPLSLLDEPSGPPLTDAEILRKSKIIEETLAQFGLPIEVSEVRVGPTVTQFGVKPGYVERSNNVSRKVRVNQISALADDLALALAAPRLRIEAPVPGRPVVGIEVPNDKIQLVGLREVLESDEFRTLKSPLAFAVGRNVAGDPVAADLSRMPHLLIAGTTGSGKSVCIKSIITCLIFNNTPAELRLVMIDPKMVELVRFNGLPHLYGHVEVDLERVVKVLRWVAWEMDRRYKQFAAASARNIEDYNRLMRRKEAPSMPRIVVLIDELADLMMIAPDEVERTICRIAQMARATGIHLVVATQRPSTDVVTGLIKANFPARISFATASQTDSRVILDMPGAETLMGHGDMLFLPSDAGYPQRIQGCYVSEDEEDRVVAFWREQVGDWAAEAPWERIMSGTEGSKGTTGGGDEEDELLPAAIALVRETGSASASLLQRKLHIGHPRAARLMRLMEERGIVGPPEAAGRSRAVIIGGEE